MPAAPVGRFLLLALLVAVLLPAALASTPWRQHRAVVRSVFLQARSDHCRSELWTARQLRRQCFGTCRHNRTLSTILLSFVCRLGCFHRSLLVTERGGAAYDQLVAAEGCDQKASYSEQLQCRTGCLQKAAGAGADSSQLTVLQQYTMKVCSYTCTNSNPAGSEALQRCSDMCSLAQVMEPDAFKKLSDCLASGANRPTCMARC